MSKKNPYKDSPYDAAGMPLGAETVDYDDKRDVAEHTVHDKYVAPLPLFSDDDEFHEKKLKRTHFNEALNNTAIQAPGHKIHEKHKEDIGGGIPELSDNPPAKVDFGDPKEVLKMEKETQKQLDKDKKDEAKESKEVAKKEDKESKEVVKTEDKEEERPSANLDFLALLEGTDKDSDKNG